MSLETVITAFYPAVLVGLAWGLWSHYHGHKILSGIKILLVVVFMSVSMVVLPLWADYIAPALLAPAEPDHVFGLIIKAIASYVVAAVSCAVMSCSLYAAERVAPPEPHNK